MKKFLNFAILAVATLSLSFASCSEDDPASPLNVDQYRTATIHGKVLIKTDEVNPGTATWVSSNDLTSENFTVTVPYADLNSAAAAGDYTVPGLVYSPMTGEFTVEVPVSVQGTTVTVKIHEFKGIVSRTSGMLNVIWEPTTEYSAPVYPGETYTIPATKRAGAAHYTVVTSVGDKN